MSEVEEEADGNSGPVKARAVLPLLCPRPVFLIGSSSEDDPRVEGFSDALSKSKTPASALSSSKPKSSEAGVMASAP